MNLTSNRDAGEDLGSAKARFLHAGHAVDFLAPLRIHPYTTVGVAGTAGFLFGSKSHPAMMKTLRLSMSVANLLKPALLLAGRYAVEKLMPQDTAAEPAAPDQTS
jgi:hypothetical protein